MHRIPGEPGARSHAIPSEQAAAGDRSCLVFVHEQRMQDRIPMVALRVSLLGWPWQAACITTTLEHVLVVVELRNSEWSSVAPATRAQHSERAQCTAKYGRLLRAALVPAGGMTRHTPVSTSSAPIRGRNQPARAFCVLVSC